MSQAYFLKLQAEPQLIDENQHQETLYSIVIEIRKGYIEYHTSFSCSSVKASSKLSSSLADPSSGASGSAAADLCWWWAGEASSCSSGSATGSMIAIVVLKHRKSTRTSDMSMEERSKLWYSNPRGQPAELTTA